MARGADQRGIRRVHSQNSSARRERRSVLPEDFLDLDGFDDKNEYDNIWQPSTMAWDDEEEPPPAAARTEGEGSHISIGGHESPASSLLIFDDDHSAFSSVSSVSPTSVTHVVGGVTNPGGEHKLLHSHKKRMLPESSLETIEFHRLIDESRWKELRRAIQALRRCASPVASRVLSSTNSRGETPLHTLAWKAPTELVVQVLDLHDVSALLGMGDRDRNTALHLACANVTDRTEFAVIRSMANLAPHALAIQNEHGDTPLHLLVSSPAFIRSTDFLKEADAASILSHLFSLSSEPLASTVNRDNATLLHISLAVGAHERVIQSVLDAAPDSARRKDHLGFLPLHYVAAFGGTPWPVVSRLIQAYPESIRTATSDGDTPLHLLMSNGAKFLRQQQEEQPGSSVDETFLDRSTTKLAELLMGNDSKRSKDGGNAEPQPQGEAYESSQAVNNLPPLLLVNKSELNPLHVSACFDSPPQLIKIVLESEHGSKAATATTSLGSTPLHLACAGNRKSKAGKSKSSKTLLAIVEALATPEACAIRDSLGRTPLMLAVQNKRADRRVIRALIRVLPASIEHRTANGYLPLHLAVQSKHAKDSVIKTLVAEFPKSIFEKTHKGDTVLHEACLVSKIPFEVVELLVRKYPGAADCVNSRLELPIDRARAMGVSKKICTLLLEASQKNLKNELEAKPAKSTSRSAASTSSEGGGSPSVPDTSAKSVGFFVPQLREPSSLQRGAPDPPIESCSSITRPADPTPLRRRDLTPEAPRSILEPVDRRSHAAKTSAAKPKASAEKQRSVSISEPFEGAKREGRAVDRRNVMTRRAMSVSHGVQSTPSASNVSSQRARTRSPTRQQRDPVTAKPTLERRFTSEGSMQPPIARKRVTRLSKGASTSVITRGEVYRFEI